MAWKSNLNHQYWCVGFHDFMILWIENMQKIGFQDFYEHICWLCLYRYWKYSPSGIFHRNWEKQSRSDSESTEKIKFLWFVYCLFLHLYWYFDFELTFYLFRIRLWLETDEGSFWSVTVLSLIWVTCGLLCRFAFEWYLCYKFI